MNPPTDIQSWLEKLGLGELAPVFEENHITPEVLHHLSDDDLREMGITSLGHRKRLLAALAGQNTPAATRAPAPPVPEPALQDVHKSKPGTPVPLNASAPVVARAVAPAPVIREVALPVVEPVAIPVEPVPPPTGRKPRRKGFSGRFLFVSVCVHLLLGVGAVYWVVQKIETKRKLQFGSGPPTANPSKRALEHKVSLQKKKNAGGSPAQARRIAVTGLAAKITLPEMPSVPTTSTQFVAGRMAGMGGAGFGSGLGFGNGSGMGVGGAGAGGLGLTMFGARGGAGLVGSFYDLKQTPDKMPSGVNADNYTDILRNWVNGGMQEKDLSKYFKAPISLSATQFMIPDMPAEEAPKAYGVEKDVRTGQWIAVYRGLVQAPADGAYRFIGAADDVLLVRVNGQLVLDASRINSSGLGPAGTIPIRYPDTPQDYIKGESVNFTANTWTPIEVVIGERPGGRFWGVLMVQPAGRDGGEIPLFRLGTGKQPPVKGLAFPKCDENAWAWRVQSGSGSSPLDALKRP